MDTLKTFYQLKKRLFTLLDDPGLNLHPEGIGQIREFVLFNELRLAFETLEDHFEENRGKVDMDIESAVRELEREFRKIERWDITD